MTRNTARIGDLQHVTGMALRAAQAELRKLNAKEEDLRRHLSDLAQHKAQIAQSARTTNDAALIAGADMRWQQWADQRRAAINIELAQVLALISQAQQRLRRAFGRDQAAQGLARKAEKDSALRRKRMSDHES